MLHFFKLKIPEVLQFLIFYYKLISQFIISAIIKKIDKLYILLNYFTDYKLSSVSK